MLLTLPFYGSRVESEFDSGIPEPRLGPRDSISRSHPDEQLDFGPIEKTPARLEDPEKHGGEGAEKLALNLGRKSAGKTGRKKGGKAKR